MAEQFIHDSKKDDQYEAFTGKYVLVQGTSSTLGIVRSVNLADGTFVMDRVPQPDPGLNKVVARDNVIVPFSGQVVMEVSKEYHNSYSQEIGTVFLQLGNWVQADENNLGRLARVETNAYELEPAVCKMPAVGYMWMPGPVRVACGKDTRLVPVDKSYIQILVEESESEMKHRRRESELREGLLELKLRELKNELGKKQNATTSVNGELGVDSTQK
jgi:hypothetical protein